MDLSTGPITYWPWNLEQVAVADTVNQFVQTSFYTTSSGALEVEMCIFFYAVVF